MTPRLPDPAVVPESFLPLHRDTFHILVSLADRDRHGYAVMQEVAERTDGKVRMSPGTLYGSIRKMLDEGLIEEFFHKGAVADDERRRYYRVTKFGRAVAAAEAERLTALLHHARLNGLVPRKG